MIEIQPHPRPERRWLWFTPVVLLVALVVAAGSALAGTHRAALPQRSEVALPRDRVRRLWLPSPYVVVVSTIAVAAFAAYWIAYPRDPGSRPVFNSPRNAVGYTLSERFVEGNGFSLPLQHYDELPRDVARALTPRDAAELDGYVVPKDFAGTMLLHGALMAVHPSLALAVGPLFAIIAGLILMRIASELFGRAAGLLAFAAFLTFPPLWINAADVFTSDLPALAFLLGAVLMFIRYWREPSTWRAAAVAGLFCASVLFRYPNVLLAAPFLAALIVSRRLEPKHLGGAMLAALPFAMTLLAFNYLVYGHPLTTGFHLGADLLADSVNYSSESFFKRRPDVLLHYLGTYGPQPLIIAPVALGLGACIWVAWRRTGDARTFALLTASSLLILLLYYGQQDAWGYRSVQLNASFLRYLLPAFALLTVYAAAAIAEAATRWGRALYAIPIAFMVASAWYVHSGPGGVAQTYDVIDRSHELQRQIVAATEPDAVIAVRIMDKVLFPERQTLTLTYAVHNESPIDKGELETWDRVPSPERFAEVALTLNARGIPVYVLPDAQFGDFAPYQEALKQHRYYLRRIRDVEVAPFFKVSREQKP